MILATIACGSSESGIACRTEISVTATGRVKSSSCRGLGEDRGSVAQVGVDVLGGARLAAGQQRAGVGEHDRVVVHVDHPRLRRGRLGDLVGIARRRDAGADVQELADPRVGGKVADDAPEERAVRAAADGYPGVGLEPCLHGRPVGCVVVLAAEHVVVHPGLVRHAGVERQ